MCQPGRPAAPGRVEGGARVVRGLPEQEVERVALQVLGLLGHRVGAGGVAQLVRAHPGERAEGGRGARLEEDVALGLVGVPALQQQRDQLEDLGDAPGDARVGVRAQHVDRVHVLQELRVLLLGQLRDRDAALTRDTHHVVVDVGDVLDVPDLEGLELQVAAHDVEDDVGEGVPEVSHVVRGDPAHVHADDVVLDGSQWLSAARERVVDLEQQRAPRRAGRGRAGQRRAS